MKIEIDFEKVNENTGNLIAKVQLPDDTIVTNEKSVNLSMFDHERIVPAGFLLSQVEKTLKNLLFSVQDKNNVSPKEFFE